MSEQKDEEKIPTINDFPVDWQIVIRATQSLISKIQDGADMEILRSDYSFVFNTKKSMLEVVYDKNKGVLKILWMKYRVTENNEIEPMFMKTIEKRVEEKEALDLISALYEKILTHIKYKSNTTVIYKDFFDLYNMFEELKKEKALSREEKD